MSFECELETAKIPSLIANFGIFSFKLQASLKTSFWSRDFEVASHVCRRSIPCRNHFSGIPCWNHENQWHSRFVPTVLCLPLEDMRYLLSHRVLRDLQAIFEKRTDHALQSQGLTEASGETNSSNYQ